MWKEVQERVYDRADVFIQATENAVIRVIRRNNAHGGISNVIWDAISCPIVQ